MEKQSQKKDAAIHNYETKLNFMRMPIYTNHQNRKLRGLDV